MTYSPHSPHSGFITAREGFSDGSDSPRDFLERGIAVAIDGVVFRDDWSQKIPQDAEVVLIPRIEGG